jgi:hypothetical protein
MEVRYKGISGLQFTAASVWPWYDAVQKARRKYLSFGILKNRLALICCMLKVIGR